MNLKQKLIYLIVLLTFILVPFRKTLAQQNFSKIIKIINGDLNNDKLDDQVIVSQNTKDKEFPYKISIYFQEKNGKYRFIDSSSKYIDPEKTTDNYPNGLEDIFIKNGVLTVKVEWLRGGIQYKFRYQNNVMSLIGLSKNSTEYGIMYDYDFNLSTGNKISKEQTIDDDKTTIKKSKLIIRPLPIFGTYDPYDRYWFQDE